MGPRGDEKRKAREAEQAAKKAAAKAAREAERAKKRAEQPAPTPTPTPTPTPPPVVEPSPPTQPAPTPVPVEPPLPPPTTPVEVPPAPPPPAAPPPVAPSGNYPAAVAAATWDARKVWDLPRSLIMPTGGKRPGSDPMPHPGVKFARDSKGVGTMTIEASAAGIVLDQWDFKGANCVIRVHAPGVNIKRSIIGGNSPDAHVPLWVGRYVQNSSLVVEDSEVDGITSGELFAGTMQVGSAFGDVSSEIILRRCRIHNPRAVTGTWSGKVAFDWCWVGAPGINGPVGLHCSTSHCHGGEHRFTNCLYDGSDGFGKTPANSWTAWIYWEPFSGANNTGGLVEHCIFVNPHPDGYYMIRAVARKQGLSSGMPYDCFTKDLVIRNNLFQPGRNGKVFVATDADCFKELHDNFNFMTGQRILDIPEKFA